MRMKTMCVQGDAAHTAAGESHNVERAKARPIGVCVWWGMASPAQEPAQGPRWPIWMGGTHPAIHMGTHTASYSVLGAGWHLQLRSQPRDHSGPFGVGGGGELVGVPPATHGHAPRLLLHWVLARISSSEAVPLSLLSPRNPAEGNHQHIIPSCAMQGARVLGLLFVLATAVAGQPVFSCTSRAGCGAAGNCVCTNSNCICACDTK